MWARIGKSTIFDLVLNAKTETNEFIEDETETEDVMSYAPALAQELQANKGDDAFDFIYDMFYNLPTGENVKKDVLLVFDGETSGSYKAWKTNATIILDHFDSVAEKVYFNIKINKIERGTATVSAGVPTFTPANSASSGI